MRNFTILIYDIIKQDYILGMQMTKASKQLPKHVRYKMSNINDDISCSAVSKCPHKTHRLTYLLK